MILWQTETGDAIVGLLRMYPGAENLGHRHPTATQHAWIIEGRVRIAGKDIGRGSYVCVPPGVDHPTVNVGSQPCTLFYVYQPFEPAHRHHDR